MQFFALARNSLLNNSTEVRFYSTNSLPWSTGTMNEGYRTPSIVGATDWSKGCPFSNVFLWQQGFSANHDGHIDRIRVLW